jgi:hypothetical protein
VSSNIRLMQTLYQSLQRRIIAQRIAMSAAVIGIDECAICTKDDPLRFRCPPSWGYALLYCLFQCVRKVVPAVAVSVECEEASIRTELNPKGGYVSPAGVVGAVDEPSFELWGEVVSSCTRLMNDNNSRLSRHSTVLDQH